MKKWLLFFVIASLFITIWLWFLNNTSATSAGVLTTTESKEVTLDQFLSGYANGLYEKIQLKDALTLKWYQALSWSAEPNIFGIAPEKNYLIYETSKPADTSLPELGIVLTGDVPVDIFYDETWFMTRLFLEQILPILFFIGLLIVGMRMMGRGAGGLPFGRQTGVLRTQTDVDTKFKDVAGMDEVKDELIEIVDFLKDNKKYTALGAKIPKWVLLYGPPGSGKTLLARAVAWEAGVPFFSASGSEFMEMLVGMWAAKVRELFAKAKKAAPAIIFIDEIDSIGKKRGWGMTWWHQEQEQTLNQILTEMDWFEKETSVIVIAATNRPDTLDSALMRSGRFDRKVMVWRPTLEERKLILEYHAKDKKISKQVDMESLARRTSGFVWADLANILNEAALKAAKDNRKQIIETDLEYALEKIIMWPEKKIKSLKEKERKIVTYHELWHAITAYYLEYADPVEKISIVSRGQALWVTWMMPEEDSYLHSKVKFLDDMVSLLWWRAAEEVFFGKDHITTWASNDFERVTKIAHNMILKYGMDEELGTLVYYDGDKQDYVPFRPFSEKTSELIDKKITWIVRTAYERAIALITENRHLMDKMAELLLEKEYITREEFELMMKDPSKIDEMVADLSKQYQKKVKQDKKSEKKAKEKAEKNEKKGKKS